MKEITLNQWLSLENLMSWDYSFSEHVHFFVKKDASFEMFCEGSFIAAIQTIRKRSQTFSIHFAFDLMSSIKSESKEEKLPSILNSLGGIALIQIADRITDASKCELKMQVLELIWERHMVSGDGMIGDGKKMSVISRFPGNPIPKCLRRGGEMKTPPRLVFEDLLRKMGVSLGALLGHATTGRFLSTFAENDLSDFLFEAFRNVIEHNIQDIPFGIWGVIVEKVIIAEGESIRSRKQVSPIIYDYLEREIARKGKKKSRLLFAVTVSDYGKGIQHTLPPLAQDDDSGWLRMLRAFEKGVSRKPKSGSPDWGQGLPNILDAADRLNAVLFIRSAEEAAFIDGGAGCPEWQRLTSKQTVNSNVSGTSLTVAWVIGDDNPDQAIFDFT